MPLNIRMQWNAGTACVSHCVLKTLACRGLRVGPSEKVGHSEAPKSLRSRFPGCPLMGFQPSGSYPKHLLRQKIASGLMRLFFASKVENSLLRLFFKVISCGYLRRALRPFCEVIFHNVESYFHVSKLRCWAI